MFNPDISARYVIPYSVFKFNDEKTLVFIRDAWINFSDYTEESVADVAMTSAYIACILLNKRHLCHLYDESYHHIGGFLASLLVFHEHDVFLQYITLNVNLLENVTASCNNDFLRTYINRSVFTINYDSLNRSLINSLVQYADIHTIREYVQTYGSKGVYGGYIRSTDVLLEFEDDCIWDSYFFHHPKDLVTRRFEKVYDQMIILNAHKLTQEEFDRVIDMYEVDIEPFRGTLESMTSHTLPPAPPSPPPSSPTEWIV
jgi:hypothetical protein